MNNASLALEPRRDLPPIPPRMAKRPLDRRGYPVPFFVAWVNGEPDFRIIEPAKFSACIKQRRCWRCGEPLGTYLAFVAGPMCVMTRTISEPPSHVECATWAVKACPFLTLPKAKRREAAMPEGCQPAPGVAILRNPGCSAVYVTKRYTLFNVSNGVLIKMGVIDQVSWWAEGRPATRQEVIDSIESGLPLLKAADGNDERANKDIDARYASILSRLPREARV